MDQALKARLIGAGVLVAAAVLLIPELLSGRKSVESQQSADTAPSSPATRTYTIELGTPAGSDSAAAGTPEVVATPVPSQVEPVTAAASRPEPEEERVAATDVPKPEPSDSKPPSVTMPSAATATPASAAEPSAAREERASPVSGGWSVQVGAFGSSDAARKLENDLEGAGFDAYVSPTKRGGKTLHRVRVGPEPAKADAAALADRLRKRGLPVSLVAND
jgi:DedD protein